MCIVNEFSRVFRKKVYDLNMSMKDVSEYLNISKAEIYRIRSGDMYPSLVKLKMLCEKLDIELSEGLVLCKMFGEEQGKDFSRRLLSKLKENNMTEFDLRLKCKVSSITISRYINGDILPSRKMVNILEDALNTEEGYFYKLEV